MNEGSEQPANPKALESADATGSAGTAKLPPKRILLFSDGTGNSSAKLFKTNVYRLYQAVDLGPTQAGDIVQIGYYSNGVGTSNFRPLAALGGIFGYGLRRNVLSLYQFLCRNYQDGDEIFLFGFSRGAFTIRLLVDLICSQGIIRYDAPEGPVQSEAELQRQSREAFRRMHSRWRLNNRLANLFFQVGRRSLFALRSAFATLRGVSLKPQIWSDPTDVRINFVGVWDTVAAYGGPIVELTRAVDDWLWPLTAPDYHLPAQVRRARHALALDDKRDSFQPLLWDETAEAKVDGGDPRLLQVWFTGMHSDVGGGYPDDSLSYVSLTWMIEQLEARLRLIPGAARNCYNLANDFGPMHDSRQGIGAYYRYQPRRLTAFLDPPTDATLGLRDPNVKRRLKGQRPQPQGLITRPQVHESVFRRIIDGTDGYGPVALPRALDIVPRPRDTHHHDLRPRLPDTLQHDLDQLADEASKLNRGTDWDELDQLWTTVLFRRAAYFLTVLPTVALLSMPLWFERVPGILFCRDDRCPLAAPLEALQSFVPSAASGFLQAWAARPSWFLLLGLLITIALALGSRLEGAINDRSRRVWAQATKRITIATEGGTQEADAAHPVASPPPPLPIVHPSPVDRARESRLYQHGLQLLKWRWLPTLIGPILVLKLVFLLLWPFAQMRILYAEEWGGFCPTGLAPDGFYRANATCNRVGPPIGPGDYLLTFRPGEPFQDRGPIGAGVSAPLSGVEPARESIPMRAAVLYKRVMTARYLQPIAVLRPTRAGRVSVGNLNVVPRPDGCWTARLRVTRNSVGELSIFANEVVPPLGTKSLFYGANTGTAQLGLFRATRIGYEPVDALSGTVHCQLPSKP